MTSAVPLSLRALLAGSVDYAGLFPPAGLALEQALANHSAYLRGDAEWMLGRFVLPSARLQEAGSLLAGRFNPGHPLRVSALGTKATSLGEFAANFTQSMDEIGSFRRMHWKVTMVEQIESSLPAGVAPGALAPLLGQAAELLGTPAVTSLRVFWEVPFDEALPAALEAIARFNANVVPITNNPRFGVKLRTGGTEAAAFPTSAQLAAALVTARDAGVAVKFTAGLHHPIRHFDQVIGTHMHGFLNVFAAGVLARERALDAGEVQAILEDERSESFRFDDNAFEWCHRSVLTAAIAAHRGFITSFGSCSFDEPCADLRRLGLMI